MNIKLVDKLEEINNAHRLHNINDDIALKLLIDLILSERLDAHEPIMKIFMNIIDIHHASKDKAVRVLFQILPLII